MAIKSKPGGLDVVDVLKPVFGKTQPRAKLREIRKEITEKDFKQRANAVLKACETDRVSAKDFGNALLRLKEAFYTHGFFTKWLRANGIDQNRASYCMRVAEGKVKEAQKKRKKYLQTVIKKDVDDVLRAATRKNETRDEIALRIIKIVRDLCHGVGRAAGWQRKSGIQIQPVGEALIKALDDLLDAMYVTYELDENGNLVRDDGQVFSDVGSALGTQHAAQAAAAQAGK